MQYFDVMFFSFSLITLRKMVAWLTTDSLKTGHRYCLMVISKSPIEGQVHSRLLPPTNRHRQVDTGKCLPPVYFQNTSPWSLLLIAPVYEVLWLGEEGEWIATGS